MNDAIEKYGHNLRSALKAVVKVGTISKAKLTETMKNIGMEVQTPIL